MKSIIQFIRRAHHELFSAIAIALWLYSIPMASR
jgi:hypothetical protein